MRIERIQTTNFLCLRGLELALTPGRAHLIAGPNAAGKSAIAEALRFGLQEETPRIARKGERKALVSDGAKGGSVTVEMAGQALTRDVGSGKLSAGTAPDLPAGAAIALGMERLTDYAPKERRSKLAQILGVEADADTIRQRLARRGVAEAHAEALMPLIRSGWEAAEQEAKRQVSEARGAWQQITGETYGAKKAEGWQPQAVPAVPDADQLQAAQQEREAAAAEVQDAQRALTEIEQRQRTAREQRERVEALRAQAGNAPTAKALEEKEAKIAHARYERDELQASLDAATPLACPACEAPLAWQDGALVSATESVPAEQIERRREKLDKVAAKLEALEQERHQAAQAQAEAQAAEKALAELAPEDPETLDGEIEQARERLQAAQERQTQAASTLEVLERQARQAQEAQEAAERAAEAHERVQAWDRAREAVSADGIPAELLAETIAPLNERLAATAVATGWAQVQITPEMAVTVGGRPYRLVSESQRWRADAALADAIAHASGLGVLILDRVDVLDLPGRAALVRWLATLEHDTVLALGTFKAPPQGLPEGVEAHWVEGGVLKEAQQEAA